jgi:hypothetical protein
MSMTLPPPDVFDAYPTTPAAIRRAERYAKATAQERAEKLHDRRRTALLTSITLNGDVADALDDPPEILLDVPVARVLETCLGPIGVEALLRCISLRSDTPLGMVMPEDLAFLAESMRERKRRTPRKAVAA